LGAALGSAGLGLAAGGAAAAFAFLLALASASAEHNGGQIHLIAHSIRKYVRWT
jgi:hypothetical protein